MGMTNFIRKVEVTVGGQTFLGGTRDQTLRIKGSITQRTTESPGIANIFIVNASRETAAIFTNPAMERQPITVSLGYVEGNYGQVFSGNVRQIRFGKFNPTDTYLNFIAAADTAYNFGNVNTTLPRNSTGVDLFNALAQALAPFGTTVGFMPEQALANIQYPRSQALFGPVRHHMRDLAFSTQSTWSMNDNAIEMVPIHSAVPGKGPWLVNTNTGMVDMPVQTLTGVVVRMLINPFVRVNGLLQLNNADIQTATQQFGLLTEKNNNQIQNLDPKGLYKILQIQYDFDTRGQEFYLTCWTISNSVPPTPAQKQLLNNAATATGVSLTPN